MTHWNNVALFARKIHSQAFGIIVVVPAERDRSAVVTLTSQRDTLVRHDVVRKTRTRTNTTIERQVIKK
jgi:hypothetical protein